MISFFSLFSIFSSFAILSSILVITSRNPIFSVLFLILTFCNISPLLFLLRLEFLPIVFLVVYIGAIAVLFLFVLMMLNLKITELTSFGSHFIVVLIILSFIFVSEILFSVLIEFFPLTSSLSHLWVICDIIVSHVNSSETFLYLSDLKNMTIIGHILFVEYSTQFLIVAFILLLAMIGSIILTLKKLFLAKTQNVYDQISRIF